MSGTEYSIEKISPTYLYLAIFVVHILILLGFCHLMQTNKEVFAELIASQTRGYGVAISREEVLRFIDLFLIAAVTAIVIEVILSLRTIPCSKSR